MAAQTGVNEMTNFGWEWQWVPRRLLLELATHGNETDVTDVATQGFVTSVNNTHWSKPSASFVPHPRAYGNHALPTEDELAKAIGRTRLAVYTILPAILLFTIIVFQVVAIFERRHRRLLVAEEREGREGATPPEGATEPQGLDSVKLEMVPQYSFRRVGSKAKKDDKYHTMECSICMEKFLEGDQIRELPGCGHIFHAECVTEWLKLQPSCPVCRRNVAETLDDQEKRKQPAFVLVTATPEGDGAAVTIGSASARDGETEMAEAQDAEEGQASEAETPSDRSSRTRLILFLPISEFPISYFFARRQSGRESVWDWARAQHGQRRARARAAAEASLRNDRARDVVESMV